MTIDDVAALVKRTLQPKGHITADSTLESLGIDSIDTMLLEIELEDDCGIRFGFDIYPGTATIADIHADVVARIAARSETVAL